MFPLPLSHTPTQVTPITDFPVPAMNLASEELIRSQGRELKGEKIIMQVRKRVTIFSGISHVYKLSSLVSHVCVYIPCSKST